MLSGKHLKALNQQYDETFQNIDSNLKRFEKYSNLLQGPKGIPGSKGQMGETGTKGSKGNKGYQGSSGNGLSVFQLNNNTLSLRLSKKISYCCLSCLIFYLITSKVILDRKGHLVLVEERA